MSFLKYLRRTYKRLYAPTFLSFEKPLTQLIRHLQPKRIVEFGPGRSTELFVKYSQARIWSFETSREWFEKYRAEFDPARVHIIYKEDDWQMEEIVSHTDTASLAFIDGGDRIRALTAVHALVGDGGVVFLHDAHREEYEPGICLYPFVYFPERHSCILSRDEQLHLRIKDAVTADYSCRCQYCSSPDRRAYFDRMSAL